MVRRLHADVLLGRKLDADLGEDFGPKAWARCAISDTSTPSMRMPAASPNGTFAMPKDCRPSRLQSDHRHLGVDRQA